MNLGLAVHFYDDFPPCPSPEDGPLPGSRPFGDVPIAEFRDIFMRIRLRVVVVGRLGVHAARSGGRDAKPVSRGLSHSRRYDPRGRFARGSLPSPFDCLDYRRQAATGWRSSTTATTASPRAAADEALAAHQGRRLIAEALESLELGRRAVFILHELDEVHGDIALSLDIPRQHGVLRLRVAREELPRRSTTPASTRCAMSDQQKRFAPPLDADTRAARHEKRAIAAPLGAKARVFDRVES